MTLPSNRVTGQRLFLTGPRSFGLKNEGYRARSLLLGKVRLFSGQGHVFAGQGHAFTGQGHCFLLGKVIFFTGQGHFFTGQGFFFLGKVIFYWVRSFGLKKRPCPVKNNLAQ